METNEGQWDSTAFDAAMSDAPGAEPMLQAFVAAVRDAANRPVAPSVQARHVAAAAAAVRPPPSTAPAATTPSLSLRWRRRISLAGLTSGLAVKMMIGTAALAAVGGGAAAATGTLPTPIQSVVAGAAGYVGIDLPDPGADPVIAVAIDENEDAADDSSADNPSAANKANAQDQQLRAAAYRADVKAWLACIHDKARNNPRGVAFDPSTVCDGHPNPADYDLPGRRIGADKDKEPGPPDHSNAPDKAGPKDKDEDQGRPDDPGKPVKDPKPPKDKDSNSKSSNDK